MGNYYLGGMLFQPGKLKEVCDFMVVKGIEH